MSRVSHMQVRKLLNEERSKKTDRQFFTSRILAAHFEDIAAAQSNKYGIKQRISVNLKWVPNDDTSAFTDYPRIAINSGCRLVTSKKTRQERYNIVCGLFAHEFGHNLFTNSLLKQSFLLQLQSGNWYPERPEITTPGMLQNEKDILAFIASDYKNLQAFAYTAKHMWNIIEDAYVDANMMERFPGKLGGCLRYLLDSSRKEMPTVTQLTDSETDERLFWFTVIELIICYAKLGEINYGETPITDERIQTLFSCINVIDDAIVSPDPKDRWRAVNSIILTHWKRVKSYLELQAERIEEAMANGQEPEETLAAAAGTMAGSSQIPSGTSAPLQGGTSGSSQVARRRRQISSQAQANNAPAEDETLADDEEALVADEEAPGSEPEEQEAETLAEAAKESETEGAEADSANCQSVGANEGGHIPYHDTASVGAGVQGETTKDDEYAGSGYPDSAKDIDDLLTRMAESQVEQKRTKEINELAQVISYGDVHQNVKKTVHRIRDVESDMIADYESIAPPLLKISRKLQLSIQRRLINKRRGGKQTGLYVGRRIDTHTIPRNDGRVFYKNSLPNETPELAVGLLLDESGSMSCNHRATYARAAAIILQDFCQALHIPVLIYGHSTGSGVDLYSYAEFDEIDRMDRYRLMDISARGCNRDGAALRFVAERLVRRPEDVKLLILVSDGQPNDDNYGGTAAEEDLRGIKQEYKRKGVNLIAVAIGDDRESIERIYGDSYLNISDLEKLPVMLTQMVKRFVRV